MVKADISAKRMKSHTEEELMSDRSASYIEEKAVSVSKEIGIQKEVFFKTTFEEIEKRLGISDESVFKFKNPKLQGPEKIRGSVFIHFSSPIFKEDIARKQQCINKFIDRRIGARK
jgi:hypothetical protein